MKQKILYLFTAALVGAFVFGTAVQAAGNHDGGHGGDHHDSTDMHADNHSGNMSGSMSGNMNESMGHKKDAMFLKKKEIDGYSVSFHIMKAKPGKEMGGSHDFMIKIEKAGKALTDVAINTKVVHPDGSSESKRVMKMGDWHMAGYDLGHKGKHQMMILFKTKDGQKHRGGIYY